MCDFFNQKCSNTPKCPDNSQLYTTVERWPNVVLKSSDVHTTIFLK